MYRGRRFFFDMEYRPTQKLYRFRTYLNQRGADLSTGTNKITFSPEYGNLANTVREDDYSSEATYIYAAGQGQGDERNVQTSSDTSRINSSPFGRVEAVRDSRNTNDNDELQSEADSFLQARRPRRTLSGRIVNASNSLYGRDWNWGDKVAVEFEGEVFTARIDTISVSLQGGRETITADIRIED